MIIIQTIRRKRKAIGKISVFLLLYIIVMGNPLLLQKAKAEQKPAWYAAEEGLTADGDAAEGIVIAVIDTGVDMNHAALKDCLWVNEAEQNGQDGVDDDGNGFVDDVHGYNVRAGNEDITDSDGHGTHVAGILGMKTEQGRNFGYGARIMIVKAGDSQNGFSADNCVKAIQYAVQNGADVITMSLGADYLDEKLEKAIHAASRKAVIVAAAGNESVSTKESGFSDSANIFPAGLPDVLGVMAYDSDRNLAWFSNWDYATGTAVDYEIAAPGVDIYSTWPGDRFKKQSGTSMAAPIAAGACGVLVRKWRENGEYEPAAMIGQLVFAADQFVRLTDQKGEQHSFPRINLEKALEVTPQPRVHIRNVTVDDDTRWGSANDQNGIVQKGESFSLSLEIFNLWAKAQDIELCVTTECKDVSVKLPDLNVESLESRGSTGMTERQNAVITFSGNIEKGQQVLLDITLRYKNGYMEDGKEYITKGKILLKEGEKELLYYEEQFGEEIQLPEESAVAAESPKPEESVVAAESPKPEESAAAAESPKPEESVAAAESPKPEESAAAAEIPKPEESAAAAEIPEPQESAVAAESPEPEESAVAAEIPKSQESAAAAESPKPEEDPAVSTVPYSQKLPTASAPVTKKTTKLYRIRVKKKRLVVVTESKAEIVVTIYPKKRMEKHMKRKKRRFVYCGKADKKGRYVLKTERLKRRYMVQIRVCKKRKKAVIQKWRLSC